MWIRLSKKDTRERIIQSAWPLFELKGFDNVTVDEIVAAANSSKGSFYHYFSSKDDLLSEEPTNYDPDYDQWLAECDPNMHSVDKLIYLGRMICRTIELNVSRRKITLVYSSQLTTKGERYMVADSQRRWAIFNTIILKGQERGEISNEIVCTELSQMLDVILRGLVYNWCLLNGTYSLEAMCDKMLHIFLDSLRSS
jgi:hypothetical protein